MKILLSIVARPWRQLLVVGLSVLSWAAAAQTDNDAHDSWQFSGDVSLSSDYIYRGISLAEGTTSPQIKAWLGHESGWFASAWLSKADIGGLGGQARSRDWEAEYSVGYRHLLNADWQLSVSNAWLEYRQQNLPRNADYQERRVQFDYQEKLTLFAAYTDAIWNTRHSQFVVAASARQHLPWQSIGEVEVGLVDLGQLDGDQYHYARVSIGRPFAKRWVGLLEYHYSGNTSGFFNSARTGSQVTVGLSYHFAH
ncbi:TorF family putative porin [Porticoccus sp. W117]|uniref:TorF family putative porin n=1 Tax=Porticoccus sp. W117 TaxID=3054777 RepID=UPI0025942307|nr:TorF family putative porin [Porticoccus sp. W117]MDM3870257.1 TorF family putative porin [Porticoccus sp. W117]